MAILDRQRAAVKKPAVYPTTKQAYVLLIRLSLIKLKQQACSVEPGLGSEDSELFPSTMRLGHDQR